MKLNHTTHQFSCQYATLTVRQHHTGEFSYTLVPTNPEHSPLHQRGAATAEDARGLARTALWDYVLHTLGKQNDLAEVRREVGSTKKFQVIVSPQPREAVVTALHHQEQPQSTQILLSWLRRRLQKFRLRDLEATLQELRTLGHVHSEGDPALWTLTPKRPEVSLTEAILQVLSEAPGPLDVDTIHQHIWQDYYPTSEQFVQEAIMDLQQAAQVHLTSGGLLTVAPTMAVVP
ncbi:hypothetical protein GCM10008938_33540 [Deinococcus roseus]|uniref:Uncharacterized protein n=2 Tax=Deinococcus roseus TaxID=392414 RepID=A0ABQ2D3E4_9DEIO|nr:hypothetical protein GCM10008938_33540 [Deinococcus roseus]